MEKTGSLNKRIIDNADFINNGRPLLHIEGKEAQGRILFATGVSGALKAFKEAQASKDPKTMIQAEQFFMKQELHLNKNKDRLLVSSLNNAIISFDDALRALSVVEIPEIYRMADMTHKSKDRTEGLPNDAFRVACSSHITRLKNNLKTSSIGNAEIELISQRLANLKTAIDQYAEKQRIALGLSENIKVKNEKKKQ